MSPFSHGPAEAAGLRCPIRLPLDLLVPPPELFLHPSRLHGQLHVARVTVHAFALLAALDLPEEASRLWAAAYLHDLARTHDGVCHRHGADAVDRYRQLHQTQDVLRRGGLRREDEEAVATAVTHHSMPAELPDAHPHRRITALLKDADALDRVRLGDPDPRFLRFEVSRSMVAFAQALFDETHSTLQPGARLFFQMWQIAKKLHVSVHTQTPNKADSEHKQ